MIQLNVYSESVVDDVVGVVAIGLYPCGLVISEM
jgi:hypothetical protein